MVALSILALVFLILPAIVADGMGHRRNRTGWPYGLLLGWLGVLILSCTSTLPSVAEMQVRQLEAQHRLDLMAAARETV